MTSSIQETVNSALQSNGLGSYMNHARPVVSALQAREADIADSLISFATSQGLGEEDATAALRQTGMFMREVIPPTPVPGTVASADGQNTGDADLAQVLRNINETLTSLSQFARSNGWRG